MKKTLKLYIAPDIRPETPDTGEGGIRRVVEAQLKHLPKHGIEIVHDPQQADVLHTHASHIVETRVRKPTVMTCHGFYWSEYDWSMRWQHAANRGVMDAMLRADVAVGVSQWVTHAMQRASLIPARTIYHGVDVDEWTPGENRGYVLWNKTRIDPICDPTPLNRLSASAPDIPFVTTFGDARENVTLTGRLSGSDAKEWVRNAGVYLCTARETFGIGTLEALACGVPVLGFNWGGQKEIIHHKVTGYLVRPYDFDGLLEGLHYCLEHRSEMSEAARADAQNWTWDGPARQYADLYKSLVPTHRGAPPQVSVVIPAYNMADTLPRAVESVIAQQGAPSYEVIIVDDASTDTTGEVADALARAHPPVRVIHNEHNQYLAGALNTGIASARGEYILNLDADNALGPPTLHTLSYFLDTDPELDIAYGKMQVVGPDEKSFVSDWPPQKASLQDQLRHRNQISSTALYRKKIWERVGGYRRRCRTAEDADFWTRALSYGARGRRVTDLVTLVYYDRSDSMSRTEEDWDWTAWYPWSRDPVLIPPAFVDKETDIIVPSYEPTLVSIVIPCAPEHVPLLWDAIDSVNSQTYHLWEVIVVYDGPTSEPLDSLRLPPYVRFLATGREKAGPAVARNRGIAESRGTYILPLDADDYLHPTALQEMMEMRERVAGKTYVFADFFKAESGETEAVNDYTCAEVLQHCPYGITTLFPYQAWVDVGGFDEKLAAWEDWDFWLALNAAGYCGIRVPRPLWYYRIGTGLRREEMFARKKELEPHIHAKWGDYIRGEKKLMACGGCGQRNIVAAPPVPSVSDAVPADDLGWVSLPQGQMAVVEYIGASPGPFTYVGANTKRRYRFGRDDEYRRHYVDRTDLEIFTRMSDFRVHLHNSPAETEAALRGRPNIDARLVAAGPPQR